MTFDARRAGRAAVLGVWATFLAWLWWGGQVARYLGPRTQWVAVAGAVLLGAAALLHLVAARAPSSVRPTAAEVGAWALLLAPVAAVVLAPAPSLGALAASRKAPVQGPIALGSLAAPAPGAPLSFIDLHYANSSESYAVSRGVAQGAPIHLLGFVARGGDAGEALQLTRFYVSCCAADAIPYSATVVLARGDDAAGVDSWLEVWGTVALEDGSYVVRAQRVEPRSEPQDPYLY
jgi:putative membrane protein